jgi:hypothetical protein
VGQPKLAITTCLARATHRIADEQIGPAEGGEFGEHSSEHGLRAGPGLDQLVEIVTQRGCHVQQRPKGSRRRIGIAGSAKHAHPNRLLAAERVDQDGFPYAPLTAQKDKPARAALGLREERSENLQVSTSLQKSHGQIVAGPE